MWHSNTLGRSLCHTVDALKIMCHKGSSHKINCSVTVKFHKKEKTERKLFSMWGSGAWAEYNFQVLLHFSKLVLFNFLLLFSLIPVSSCLWVISWRAAFSSTSFLDSEISAPSPNAPKLIIKNLRPPSQPTWIQNITDVTGKMRAADEQLSLMHICKLVSVTTTWWHNITQGPLHI